MRGSSEDLVSGSLPSFYGHVTSIKTNSNDLTGRITLAHDGWTSVEPHKAQFTYYRCVHMGTQSSRLVGSDHCAAHYHYFNSAQLRQAADFMLMNRLLGQLARSNQMSTTSSSQPDNAISGTKQQLASLKTPCGGQSSLRALEGLQGRAHRDVLRLA